MSVRRKTLLAVGLTSISLLVILLLLAQYILLRGFDGLQEDAVQQNVQRVQNAIANEIDSLDQTIVDWAYWDDTYQFVQDKNQNYLDSNLSDEAVINLDLNLIVFTDMNNRLIFGKWFDSNADQLLALPADLSPENIQLQSILDLPELKSNHAGILMSSEGPMLVAARSVLTSEQTGPAMGKMVFGWLLDEAEVKALAEQTQLEIDFRLLNAADLPSDFLQARSTLIASDPSAMVYTMRDQMARGYFLVHDISGKPVLIAEIGMPNSIYQQGQKMVFYFAIALLIASITFGVMVMVLLERIIVSRVAYLSRRVQEIAGTNNLSDRITIGGSDELSALTTTLNNSLAVMERSQVELQQLNLQLEENIKDLNAIQTQKDRFFANASHNFRTPLAVLRTYVYLIENEPDKWKKHLGVLKEATTKLTEILSDVFDVTNFNRQTVKLERLNVDFKDFLTKLPAIARPRIHEKGLRLSTHMPDEIFNVRIDRGYFEKAVDNVIEYLVDNSIAGSEILLSLTVVEDRYRPYADLRISSPGVTLNTEDVSQIFSPFYHPSEGNNHDTGLRLTIAKEIIELHDGEIDASHTAEAGLSFSIKLPLVRVKETGVQA